MGQQCATEPGLPGRLGVVRSTAGPGEELLGIIRSVEEATASVGKVGQRRLKQISGGRQPRGLPGGLVKGQQALCQVAVVVSGSHRSSDHALT
jgi:hypothetical protein